MTTPEVERLALAAGVQPTDSVRRFGMMVAAWEKERCAQVAEDHFMSDGDWIAKQIRTSA